MTQGSKELDFQLSLTKLPLPHSVIALTKSPAFEAKGVVVNLKSGFDTQTLKISSTPNWSVRGESNILRFIARLDCDSNGYSTNALYPEANASLCYGIDTWLQLVDTAIANDCSPKDVQGLAEKVNSVFSGASSASKSVVIGSDSLTLADFSVWSFFKGHDTIRTPVPTVKSLTHFKSWMESMDSLAQCKQASEGVDFLIKTIKSETAAAAPSSGISAKDVLSSAVDPLRPFELSIAELISPHCGIPVEQLVTFVTVPKTATASKTDYCVPVARLRMKGNPVELAKQLVEKIKPNEYVGEVSHTGQFLNFALQKNLFRDVVLRSVHQDFKKYGCNASGEGKTVVVEFSSPNIAKPFHAGHLRSTIIGNFIRNVCDANGFKTTAINYLGDWGKQYGLLAVGFGKYGSEEALLENPIKHLFDVYVKISADKEKDPEVDKEAFAYFKRMEDGDNEALGLWKRFRDLSIEKYRDIYSRLNISFDVYSGESLYSEKMKTALADLKGRGVLTESGLFNKGLLAWSFSKFGDVSKLESEATSISHLLEVYCKGAKERSMDKEAVDAASKHLFTLLKDKDEETVGLFKKFSKVPGFEIGKDGDESAHFNVSKDVKDKYGLADNLEYLRTQDSLEFIADLSKYKLPPARVQRADGATLYITRDIAAAIDRKEEYNFHKMYYCVGIGQDLHFQSFFKILNVGGYEFSQDMHHIAFGLVKGMSTRKGNVVFLEDILNEAQSTMHGVMQSNEAKYKQIQDPEKVADIVGLSAVMVQDMSSRRVKDYEFSWSRMMSFEGDTGPYLQYSHSRMCSIERNYLESLGIQAKFDSVPPIPFLPTEGQIHLDHSRVDEVLFLVAQYPEQVRILPARNYESAAFVTYLMQLCHKVSSCLEDVYVMGRDKEVAQARFWLYWSARVTLGNGMRLLGLRPLERM